jgi:hypothetical protein
LRTRRPSSSVGILLLMAVAAGQAGTDPNAVLERARARLRQMAEGLERYVCIETLDRASYRRVLPADAPVQSEAQNACGEPAPASELRLASTDRVRFEVTVSQGRELHSWPGATRFDARDVDELVRDGPVSTGSFGAYLTSIFGRSGVTFRFIGEHQANGKSTLEYGYRVPLEASRLEIRVGAGWRPAAYEGEFQIDPATLDLEGLTVRTTRLPEGASFCQAAATLAFSRVPIGGSEVLLPLRSQLDLTLPRGSEARNVTSFANCREYQAESEILFGDPVDSEAAARPSGSRGRLQVPLGLPVTLALDSPIDTATAAAGDEITAKLVKPVRRPGSSEDLVPAGSVVHGHIRRVEHHLSPTPYFLVSIAFNRVDVQGAVSPFMVRGEVNEELAKQLGAELVMRQTGIRFWGVGTFLFPSKKDHLVVPAGFQSKWFTLATGSR